jgi:hypothetical protein
VDYLHASDFAPIIHSHGTSGLLDGSVTNAKVADAAITADKLAGLIGVEKLATYAGVRVVHQGAVDSIHTFSSVEAALASITDNSATNRYAILIMPGIYAYTGNEALSTKPFVDLLGQSRRACVLQRTGAGTTSFVTITTSSDLQDLTVRISSASGVVVESGGRILDCDIEMTDNAVGLELRGGGLGKGLVIRNVSTDSYNGIAVVIPMGSATLPAILNDVVLRSQLRRGVWVQGDQLLTTVPAMVSHLVMEGICDEFGIVSEGTTPLLLAGSVVRVTGAGVYAASPTEIDNCLIDSGSAAPITQHNYMVNIRNSTIIGNISDTNNGGAVLAGNSQITGTLSDAVKTVGCFDSSFDPIPDGWH